MQPLEVHSRGKVLSTQLIEELSKSNYITPSKASRSSRRLRHGVIELNKFNHEQYE